MKLGIMQPYLFPYIGYFQLMNAVDEFVVYDNIEFTKKGWINRNKILVNGKDEFITLPVKKGSDFLYIQQRALAEVWPGHRTKMLNRIVECYKKAPYFQFAFPVVEKSLLFEEINLFKFLFNSLKVTKDYLEIETEILISSSIEINHDLKGEKKVIEICKARNATTYLNAIGGMHLYSTHNFKLADINLRFLKTDDINYSQFKNEFVPFLSIIDLMMFNSKEDIKNMLTSVTVISE